MSPQPVDSSETATQQVKEDVYGALGLSRNSTEAPVLPFETTKDETTLWQAARCNNLPALRDFFEDPRLMLVAVDIKLRHQAFIKTNLDLATYVSVLHGHVDATDFLLRKAKELGQNGVIDGWTVKAAINSWNVDVLRKMVELYPECLKDVEMWGDITPLRLCIGRSRPSNQHNDLRGPMSKETEIQLVRFFVCEAKADVNAKSGQRKSHGTYLMQAVLGAPTEVLNILIENGAQVRQSGAIQRAAQRDKVEAMKILLKNGADVNERLEEPLRHTKDSQKLAFEKSQTPLHHAVENGSVEAARCLIEYGADPEIMDLDRASARDLAASSSNEAMKVVFGIRVEKNVTTIAG